VKWALRFRTIFITSGMLVFRLRRILDSKRDHEISGNIAPEASSNGWLRLGKLFVFMLREMVAFRPRDRFPGKLRERLVTRFREIFARENHSAGNNCRDTINHAQGHVQASGIMTEAPSMTCRFIHVRRARTAATTKINAKTQKIDSATSTAIPGQTVARLAKPMETAACP
jgi:hypothetical protein